MQLVERKRKVLNLYPAPANAFQKLRKQTSPDRFAAADIRKARSYLSMLSGICTA